LNAIWRHKNEITINERFLHRDVYAGPGVNRWRSGLAPGRPLPATVGGTDFQAYYDPNFDITWAQELNLFGFGTQNEFHGGEDDDAAV